MTMPTQANVPHDPGAGAAKPAVPCGDCGSDGIAYRGLTSPASYWRPLRTCSGRCGYWLVLLRGLGARRAIVASRARECAVIPNHIPPSTKYLTGDIAPRLWDYLAATGRALGVKVLATGGTDDHVHLLISPPVMMGPAKAMQVLKANSSRWLRQTFPKLRLSSWQDGYGAFFVGISQVQTTITYIQSQAEHHRRVDFTRKIQRVPEEARDSSTNGGGLTNGSGARPSLLSRTPKKIRDGRSRPARSSVRSIVR